MNRTELIAAMAVKNEMTKTDNEKALVAFMDVVKEELTKGGKIALVGFGNFEVTERSAREGINPQAKEKIQIPSSKAPKFKASKNLKEAVNA